MKTTLLSLAIAACFGLSTTVSADDAYQGSWYAVPGIGIMHADSDLKTESNGPAGFLRFGKALSDHWDVQLGLSHTKLDSDNSLSGLNLDGDYKQTVLGLDALYMFSRDKFRPFVLAGLGYARNNIDYKLAGINIGDQNNSWMANVGAGFQYFFTDNIGLQADLRHVWSRAEAKAHVAGFEVASSDTVGNTYLNLGLVFNFGAPAKTVAAAPAPAMEEVAAHEEEALPPLVDESLTPQPEVVGPAQPVFERMTLQAEVLFAFDKDSLKENGKHILDVEVVEKMRAHPEVELVLITGHTDRIGDDKYNQKLSERRANQVKKYIASQGIAESRLHAVGKGEKEPVADCKGVRGKKLIECLQPNRRVVVEIEAQRQTGQ